MNFYNKTKLTKGVRNKYMLRVLDECLLKDDACSRFMYAYNNNVEFKVWITTVLPEVLDCLKQKQNNPWHKYGVLQHILHSVEAMNNQTKHLNYTQRRMLAYTMFLHDIGKPKCHITREKDGKTIDSFFNHNIAGEEIARRVLNDFGFSKQEQQIICKLVNKHDIFMFIKPYKSNNQHWKVLSYKLLEDEIKDLNEVGNGMVLMKYLVMVGRADNLAQNEKMTGDSLKLLDNIDNMLYYMQHEKNK